MALKNGRTTASIQTIVLGNAIPVGTIAPYTSSIPPAGWLLCNGAPVSVTTYASLYQAIGQTYGGNGGNTFNLPDFQGSFLRGHVNINNIFGSAPTGNNNATFMNHGINRTGFKVRLNSGTLTGLATNTVYYVIRVDSNTLAFASTYANAMAGSKIAISGTNSAVMGQYEDPDAASRVAVAPMGAGGGNSIGALQTDAIVNITGAFYSSDGITTTEGAFANTGNLTGSANPSGSGRASSRYAFNASSVVRTASEVRPQNMTINYIIKF